MRQQTVSRVPFTVTLPGEKPCDHAFVLEIKGLMDQGLLSHTDMLDFSSLADTLVESTIL